MTSRNPYHFGSPVDPPHFCDRDPDVGDLVTRMGNGIHVFVLGPRRYGKTSIVTRALHEFARAGGHAGYADLIRCTSELDVATEVVNAVVRGVLTGPRRVFDRVETVIKRLRVAPTVSVDQSGAVSLGFDAYTARPPWQAILDDALGVLEEAAGRAPTALALDEFQRVADIGRNGMGGTFKAAADRLTKSSLVLAGSHMAVMERLTRARGAPLSGMGELVTIDVIDEDTMVAYLRRRARAGGKRLSPAAARQIYALADAVPNDVQWLAFSAYEAAGGSDEIDETAVSDGMAAIVSRQASSCAERFESLAPSQQRMLKALARRPASHLYAREFLDAVGVANANAVRTALAVLEGLELVRRRRGRYEVANPFLRGWLLLDPPSAPGSARPPRRRGAGS